MKITKQQLKQIIKEELESVMDESDEQLEEQSPGATTTPTAAGAQPAAAGPSPEHLKKVSKMALDAYQGMTSTSQALKSLKAALVKKGLLTMAELQGKTQAQYQGTAGLPARE